MKLCESRFVEIFYRRDGEPVEVYPRFCLDESAITSPKAPSLTEGITLLEQMRKKSDSSICFWRTYALGDILLLTPIFNWLKEEYPACRIYLATDPKFLGLFKYWDVVTVIDKRMVLSVDYDVGYYLDGIVEKDHRGMEESYKHRLDIYCEFLGIPVPKEPVFSLPFSENEKEWAEGVVRPLRKNGKPVVAMQIFGSTFLKRLPFDKVVRIVNKLSDMCSLVLVHDAKEYLSGADVLNLTGETNIHQLTAVIDSVDSVITMDSGILWVAHCTKTPVIALLGPTREQERLKYHRNYVVVNLAEMVGCEPCFERMERCHGLIDCMNLSDEEEITERIKNGVKGLVYS